MSSDLADLKKHLADAQERLGHIRSAVKRLQNTSKWAKGVNLDGLAKKLDGEVANLKQSIPDIQTRIKKLKDQIKHFGPSVPPYNNGWYPPAKDDHYASSGSFTVGKKKVVLHTTEGSSLPRYSGSNPHFTLDPKTGTVWQHVSIEQASSALVNAPGGVETNHAGAIQIEMIGFAADTPNWSDAMYANVKALVDWIRKYAGIGTAHPDFATTPHRMSGDQWLSFNGVCGHEHVPENEHWDPGAFKIAKIF